MKFGIWQDDDGLWHWGVADNEGQYVLHSLKTYPNKAALHEAIKAANSLMSDHYVEQFMGRIERTLDEELSK